MADEGIKAGESYVEVSLRMAKDAFAKLAADNNAAANKAGDNLGDRIGKAIAKRIATSVKDGLTQGGVGVGAQGAKQGEEFGGKFAEVVKTRIAAALKSLPKADVDLGTVAANEKLAELRARLEDLQGKRVGVDITAADALAEIRDIKTKLVELGAKSPNIQVKTDTAAASAQLAGIQAQLARINGQSATANVNTNAGQSTRDVFNLVNAVALIGPAAIPSAAAAAAAILGVGVAATSMFAAVGVGKLAFSGVGAALKAMDVAQQQTAKSGATLGQQQTQLASGADQVKSAEASLANTRASAADSVRRANEQIGVSEQTLADAERSELRAQQDLTLARQDAKRSIEDLNTQVADGALQQRQAALDLDKARIALAAVNAAGSGASADQRAQAQLTYDQAVQQVTDLSVRQQRAIQDRDAANKAGVEGSRQVKTAQDQLAQAQQKIGDAERGVADARAAAAAASRQAAFGIAQAQQQVASSQRSLGQAFVATAATGGAATDALRIALANLSPEGQKFATFLYGLKPRLDQLKESAQGGLLPGAQEGITTLLPYFGQLDRFVASVATELGSLARQAATTFTSPFWRQFFGFIGDQAVPNLDSMYRSIINVAEGGARIIEAFGPVGTQVGGIILDLTTKFVNFSRNLGQNQGFQQFVAFAKAEIPHLVSAIEALGGAAVHLAAAYAPVGSIVVDEIKLLSRVISAIPIPVLTTLAAAFTAYRTASVLSTAAQALVNSGLVTGIGSMLGYSTATAAATSQANAFAGKQAAVSSALGGPLIAALTIAGTAFAYFYAQNQQKQQAQKAEVDNLTSTLTKVGDEYKTTGSLSAETFRTFTQGTGAVQTLTAAFAAQGLSLDDLGKSYQGNLNLQRKLSDSAHAFADSAKAQRDSFLQGLNTGKRGDGGPFSFFEGLTDKQKNHLKDLTKQSDDAGNAAQALDKSYKQAAASASAYAVATGHLLGAAGAQTNAFIDLGRVVDNAKASADDYKTAIAAVSDIEADAGAKAETLAGLSDKVAGSQLNATEKATVFAQILHGIGDSATTTGATFDALATTFGNIAGSALDAHDKVNLLKQALQQAYGPAQDQYNANENLVRSQAGLVTQLQTSSAGFTINSKTSAENKTAILQNRDALKAALTAAQDKYVQDLANNVTETDARKTHEAAVDSILQGIPKTQRGTAAVKELVDKFGTIPPDVKTNVTTPGLDDAIGKLIHAHSIQFGMEQHPPWGPAQVANEDAYMQRVMTQGLGSSASFKNAAGGPIVGPGTGTSDDIPAFLPETGTRYRLSNDEHIMTAAEVRAAGGHSNVLALRKTILDGGLKGVLPGFAKGGAVWPVEIPSSPQPPIPLAELVAKWHAAIAAQSAAGSIGSAFGNLGPLVFDDSKVAPAKIAAIKGFLRSVDPLPYVFGAAGPGAFDCSGLVGEVWARLTGHPSDRRYFTTFDFTNGAPAGFKPGANGGVLSIGVNPTEHMAGNFDGLPFEAKSTAKGIVVGAGVTPVGAFQKQFHMAQGGPVDGKLLTKLGLDVGGDPSGMTVDGRKVPYKLFDDGGWLAPGLSIADNRTGGYERVQNQEQMAASSGPLRFDVVLEAADPAIRDLMKLIDVRVEASSDRVASAVESGVRY